MRTEVTTKDPFIAAYVFCKRGLNHFRHKNADLTEAQKNPDTCAIIWTFVFYFIVQFIQIAVVATIVGLLVSPLLWFAPIGYFGWIAAFIAALVIVIFGLGAFIAGSHWVWTNTKAQITKPREFKGAFWETLAAWKNRVCVPFTIVEEDKS